MHFLDRRATSAPDCLAAYDHRTQTWDDVGPCKAAIRDRLAAMQIDRCAYCEAPLYGGGHIEHFRRKNRAHFPDLTFCWDNLFLSCDGPGHCGHFKDRKNAPRYDVAKVIKPDSEDPEDHLYFHSNGEVRSRLGGDQERADETIRVFGLNDGALQDLRRKAVERYLRGCPANFECLTPDDLEKELAATENSPFRTTVHHFLKKYL